MWQQGLWERGKRTLLLNSICACARVVDHYGINVIVSRVLSVQHRISNVRHVVSGIAFASNEDLTTLQSKEIYKVLEEAQKFPGNVRLAGSVRCSLRKPSSHWLLDPHHVGKIDPGPFISERLECAILP